MGDDTSLLRGAQGCALIGFCYVIGSAVIAGIFVATEPDWLLWTVILASAATAVAFGTLRTTGMSFEDLSALDHAPSTPNPTTRSGYSQAKNAADYDDEDDDWEDRYATIAADPRWSANDRGTEAAFTYVDVHGEVTDRHIRNWRSSGPYINGWCIDRRASRTFRKDRIEAWTVPD